jgi:pimeloyl-ACP methyl ester carboxylesterase
VLAVRGELSDILSATTLQHMARDLKGLETVTVPRVGHAPTLEEPAAQQAIAALLAKSE